MTTITRLRRDAAVSDLPIVPEKRGRGAPKKYGERIDMKAMVEDEEGWQYVECRQYGQVVTKRVKCFVATSKLTRGKPIKVALIKEDEKTFGSLGSILQSSFRSIKTILVTRQSEGSSWQ